MELFSLLIATIVLQGCGSLSVYMAPFDTATELGTNVSLACMVYGVAETENVQWKHRPVNSATFRSLTFNENVLASAVKYAVKGTYNLTIVDAQATDAGTYRCVAGTQNMDANLTVVDLPQNVSIFWSSEPTNGHTVNLTCQATHGLPPPSLRWVVNNVDVTNQAVNVTRTTARSGYGNSTSYLPLALDTSINGQGARCIVHYPGWNSAAETTFTILTRPNTPTAGTVSGYEPVENPGVGVGLHTDSIHSGGSPRPGSGVFLIKFFRESASEKVDVVLQQYTP